MGSLASWMLRAPTVLPLSRGREGRFVQEATAPEASGEGLGEREDPSPSGSHNPPLARALVSIAMVPPRGEESAAPGLRRNPDLASVPWSCPARPYPVTRPAITRGPHES